MIKKFEQVYIRRMANIYREQHMGLTIRQAVRKAYEAYDIYRDVETRLMYDEYEKTVFKT